MGFEDGKWDQKLNGLLLSSDTINMFGTLKCQRRIFIMQSSVLLYVSHNRIVTYTAYY